jgi:hypothetical protein
MPVVTVSPRAAGSASSPLCCPLPSSARRPTGSYVRRSGVLELVGDGLEAAGCRRHLRDGDGVDVEVAVGNDQLAEEVVLGPRFADLVEMHGGRGQLERWHAVEAPADAAADFQEAEHLVQLVQAEPRERSCLLPRRRDPIRPSRCFRGQARACPRERDGFFAFEPREGHRAASHGSTGPNLSDGRFCRPDGACGRLGPRARPGGCRPPPGARQSACIRHRFPTGS